MKGTVDLADVKYRLSVRAIVTADDDSTFSEYDYIGVDGGDVSGEDFKQLGNKVLEGLIRQLKRNGYIVKGEVE